MGRYLKWDNDIIGVIDGENAVAFLAPNYNETVALYTQGASVWTAAQLTQFLSERTVSRERRDIEKILFRCGLSRYDLLRICEITRGIHPKDLLWIANDENETLESVMTEVFSAVFKQKIDAVGESVDTPEGYNIKRYGVWRAAPEAAAQYGIYKQRISPLATDAESELAVFQLAQRLGVPCCPVYRADKDTIFSAFLYDFSKEYIVHFRRLFDGARSENEYQNLVALRPQYQADIARMILLDFITRQDDRHLSNIAVKISGKTERFYPLYDNGRSLFYEDTREMVQQAIQDPAKYATGFGYAGTYWDAVQQIAQEQDISAFIRLDVSEQEIAEILQESGFTGYRLDGARQWIAKTLEILRTL